MTDQELLSAYIDGGLDDAAMNAVEVRLENDAVFAARLQRLIQSDAQVQAAFAGVLTEPVPPRLTATASGRPEASNDNRRFWFAGGAIAASMALALAVMGGQRGSVVPGSSDPISVALEGTPSLKPVVIPGKGTLTPQMSFASKDGSYCRVFDLDGASETQSGLACRTRKGWAIEALARRDASTRGAAGFETAAGTDSPVDASANLRRVGDPLGSEDEAALIARGWDK